MQTLANSKLQCSISTSSDSVVSENISVCSTQLKQLGKIVYRSKIRMPQDINEFQKNLHFASKLSGTQRELIDKLLGMSDSSQQNTSKKTFINDLGFEEDLEPDSVTIVNETVSEGEDDEEYYDPSFINDESEDEDADKSEEEENSESSEAEETDTSEGGTETEDTESTIESARKAQQPKTKK